MKNLMITALIFASLSFSSQSVIAGDYANKVDAEAVISSYFSTYTALDDKATVADYNFSEKWVKQFKISPQHDKFGGFRCCKEFEFIAYKAPFYTTAIFMRNTATHKIDGLSNNDRVIHVLGVFKIVVENGRALIEPQIEKDSLGTIYVKPYKVIYDQKAIQKALAVVQARERSDADRKIKEYERNRPIRQLCEAQKQTCIASCPRDSVFTSLPDSLCKSRCESVSCY